MRRALNVILVLGGILVGVMASPSKSVTPKDDFHNVVVIEGLHIALPPDMKNFPTAVVPLP
jgi:hypothetical protein